MPSIRRLSPSPKSRSAHRDAQSSAAPLDRKSAILSSAERLFARDGYHGVSIRDIAQDAQVPIALVGYHFGPKHELFAAIFEHRKSYIEERLRGLEQRAPKRSTRAHVESIVRAWAAPVLRMRADASGEAFSILVARGVWDQTEEAQTIIARYYDPMARAFIDALAAALPTCSRETIVWGYEFALGALLMHTADRRVERLSNGRARAGDPAVEDQLVAFISAGLLALPGVHASPSARAKHPARSAHRLTASPRRPKTFTQKET